MRKTAIGLLMIALLIALTVCAQAAVELYEVQASTLVPAFIDYKLNCAADITISILPCDEDGGNPLAAIRTITLTAQARGFHRYIWLADKDDTSTASPGFYKATVSAAATQASWNKIIGIYKNDDWTHEYAPNPGCPDVEGFYDIAINTRAASPYYGRIYVTHKIQRDIFMYGPDGAYIGKFNDDGIGWGGSAPWNVAVADDDYVYVTDRSNAVIYCFTPNGQTRLSIGTGTYFRGFFARTDGAGVTHLFMTGSGGGTYKVTVQPDHTTYSGMQFCYNTGGGDGWDAYGLWVSPDLRTSYAACLQGPSDGLTRWLDPEGDGSFARDAGFPNNFVGLRLAPADVTLVDGATPYLWVTQMIDYSNDLTSTTYNDYARAAVKASPVDGTIVEQDLFNLVTWGHLSTVDSVGNLVLTYGKSTASWAQKYWGVYAVAGASAATKTTGVFELTSTPAPVVVPGSAAITWTPDGTIAADDTDAATVAFKVMDINGWADITSVTLDLRPLGYLNNTACTLSQDVSDTLGKTAIATRVGIKAKIGARATTSNGQLPHYLVATATDSTGGWNIDETQVALNVSGDPSFDANIKHRRISTWTIDGAYIVAVGGGITGATDPRAAGPFTYTSVPSVSGYASLEMSAGVFQVNAQKTGFGSEATTSITVPYTGITRDLFLRPMTIAEARAATNGTTCNVEGVCFAQPKGLAPTAVNGLDSRTDTLKKRNQWYVCDANAPANGMLFALTEQYIAPENFEIQWDDAAGQDMFGNSTYMGKRPAQGETIMITGLLDAPGGAERRVLMSSEDVVLAMAAVPIVVNKLYLNRGDLGGLPTTPVSKTIADIYHPMTTAAKTEWGQYVQVTGATVVGLHADGLPNPNPQDLSYTFPPYFTVADTAGNQCEVVLETPTTLGITTWASTVTLGTTFTIKGAGGRRTRYGNGCIRIRSLADLTQTAPAPAVPGVAGSLDVARTGDDGDPVNVRGIVTLKSGTSLWIEAADRSIGIRVKANPAHVVAGADIQVVGTLGTENGERVITPTMALIPLNTGNTIGAFDIRSREIGGTASGTAPGVDTGRGALNVGLKVHFLGMVTGIGAGNAYYYLWDGANRADLPTSDGNADGFLGVKVAAAPPAAVAAWTNWVEVTGIVSTQNVGGAIIPTIVPISAAKVTAFDTITADAGTGLNTGWNLMSIPVAPAADSDGEEFSSSGAGKAWETFEVLAPTNDPAEIDGRMYRWENCSGGLYMWDYWSEYGTHGPFGGLIPGDGAWLLLDSPWAVNYSGKNTTLDEWVGVCSPGWVMMGHPKDHNTFLADVMVHDGGAVYSMYDAVLTNAWIDCAGYWWDNASQGLMDIGIPDCWGSTDTLMPYHGYWMLANRGDLALIVPEAPVAP